jgi:hypothetical protein
MGGITAPSGIGTNQTWKAVGRSGGVTYTNTTGKPIFVSVACAYNGSTSYLTIDGIIASQFGCTSAGTLYLTAIVPPNSTYLATLAGALTQWNELS